MNTYTFEKIVIVRNAITGKYQAGVQSNFGASAIVVEFIATVCKGIDLFDIFMARAREKAARLNNGAKSY
ncbi:hypothetical protein [Geotalea sp. SG265]|uniref:hypothetical protein n=1 Tax=Geotalea sp. SG265 TaxID=2922867 RepID=UPI001FAEA3D2|nr:hypothetical protein [Geotalea sp. SG265]